MGPLWGIAEEGPFLEVLVDSPVVDEVPYINKKAQTTFKVSIQRSALGVISEYHPGENTQ